MPYNENIPGFMNVRDLHVLERLAQRIPPNGIIVEIGSFMGRSSWALAQTCDPSVKVYCIDPWEFNESDEYRPEIMYGYHQGMRFSLDEFKKYTFDCPNIVPIQAKSLEVPWPKNLKVDMVFIDALHQSPYVNQDIDCWVQRLKPNGILSGHDFNMTAFPDVCRAVLDVSERLHLPVKFYKNSYIWFIDLDPAYYTTDDIWVTNPWIIQRVREFIDHPEYDF